MAEPMGNINFRVGGSELKLSANSYEFIIDGDADRSIDTTTLVPVTVLNTATDLVSLSWIEENINTMLKTDDVYEAGFASCVLLRNHLSSTKRPIMTEEAKRCFQARGITAVFIRSMETIPPGPYVVFKKKIYEVLKLYSDPYGAFMYGMESSTKNGTGYRRLDSGLIPVPSRLYFGQPTATKPLNGKRIAVKDIFDISGVPTIAGSRSYELYIGDATTTASSIQGLIDLGAVIVGKTKTTQFASGEFARDWVDFQCPFNPRGDGYFDTGCSSAGSAVGVAAYEWLDYTIGSDTLGSITEPAAAQGIYGVRPTHGFLALDGIIPVSSALDTPGYFSRSIRDLNVFGRAWYGEKCWKDPIKPPAAILLSPELFDVYSGPARVVMIKFVQDLEKTLNIPRVIFDVKKLWDEYHSPSHAQPIEDYLSETVAHIQLWDSDKFEGDFTSRFRQMYYRDPYTNPMVKFKRKLAAEVSLFQYEESLTRMKIFKDFVRTHVFKENTIMILPGGEARITYRDAYLGPEEQYGYKLQGFGFHHKMYSCLGGLPQIALPVGEQFTYSPVNNTLVPEPVSLIIVGPAGSDNYLIEIVERVLVTSGRPLEVTVGASAFAPKRAGKRYDEFVVTA